MLRSNDDTQFRQLGQNVYRKQTFFVGYSGNTIRSLIHGRTTTTGTLWGFTAVQDTFRQVGHTTYIRRGTKHEWLKLEFERGKNCCSLDGSRSKPLHQLMQPSLKSPLASPQHRQTCSKFERLEKIACSTGAYRGVGQPGRVRKALLWVSVASRVHSGDAHRRRNCSRDFADSEWQRVRKAQAQHLLATDLDSSYLSRNLVIHFQQKFYAPLTAWPSKNTFYSCSAAVLTVFQQWQPLGRSSAKSQTPSTFPSSTWNLDQFHSKAGARLKELEFAVTNRSSTWNLADRNLLFLSFWICRPCASLEGGRQQPSTGEIF